MSILAGIVSRRGAALEARDVAAMRESIVRRPGGELREVTLPRAVLFSWSPRNAETICRDEDGNVTLLAGDPLLPPPGDVPPATTAGLHDLHAICEAGRWNDLASARGTWCAAHLTPGAEALHLVSDQVGLRPVYYWAGKEFAAFATALRIVGALPSVSTDLDARAALEICALGYPLGDRTPYERIKVLRGAEVVTIDGRTVTAHRYRDWSTLPASEEAEEQLLVRLHRIFEDAVTLRLGADRKVAAFLSGGLDSRAVVATLRDLGREVVTFNFSPPGSQDATLGLLFANAAGTTHVQRNRPKDPHWSQMISDAVRDTRIGDMAGIEHPDVVWGGDGGSVVMGHVHITPEIVQELRVGNIPAAAARFIAQQGTAPRALFRLPSEARAEDVLAASVAEEISSWKRDDPVRNFHLFLLDNDQRRHLARHFEDIDLHRMEFALPFFDARVVEAVIAAPIEWFLAHRFYMKWLAHFPPVTLKVLWQSYPGHEPCPLPAPAGLSDQWSGVERRRAGLRDRVDLATRAIAPLATHPFGPSIFRRGSLLAAAAAYVSGIRDTSTTLNAAVTVGRYAMPRAVK